MVNKYTLLLFGLIVFANSQSVVAQHTDVPPAQFDVIVKNNGEIITAKVMEVGLQSIRYKRTDIPDGPVYEIKREEVFAISYRNQLKEYISPVDSTRFAGASKKDNKQKGNAAEEGERWHSNIRFGEFRIGAGFIRNFSKIKDAGKLTNEQSGPGVFVAYVFPFRKNVTLGLLSGLATYKYSEVLFSEFDQLQTERDIKENLFSLSIIGKYSTGWNFIDPYILGGLSFTTSNVRSDGSLTFLDDERVIKIQNSARGSSLGILFRVGFQVNLSSKIGIYSDIGNGLSLVQIGGTLKLNER
ncbi:MAG: hypothetical protein KF725_04390 [Cyclobacteriaceae bacterium]|nr:hypothetical protein [Cyclobacteriaceae bacterium]UYN85721.1 MAG: hypothetical protein KIT51_12670 [Cyclobacteriaceae bacterium]